MARIYVSRLAELGRVRTVERVGRAIRADGLASVQRNSAAVRAREGWSGMCFYGACKTGLAACDERGVQRRDVMVTGIGSSAGAIGLYQANRSRRSI
jgi:hypothetical protein